MKRGIALVAVVVVLVGIAGIAAAGPVGTAAAQDDPVATNETSEDSETANETAISPGERLSGVIGVQRAEISGEVDSRAFEVGLNRTENPEERAALVAERVNRTEERLDGIERRQAELRERREAGELGPGEFAARMAETSARAETAKREANRSAEVARGLPESVRADRGLDEERLGHLRQRAGNATGPEIAAIARGVAGNGVGGPLAADRRGPPRNAGPGDESSTGNGRGAGDGTRTGDGLPGRDNVTGTDANGTNASGGPTGAVGAPVNDGRNPTNESDRGSESDREGESDRGSGGDGSDRRSGGDGSDRGSGNAPGANAVGTIDVVTERLAGSLADGANRIQRAVGIDG